MRLDRARALPCGHAPSVGRPSGHAHGRFDGFTLIEVVVALVIFALSFGVLAQIIQTGFRQSALADATVTATLIARSQLARAGIEFPLEVGEQEGDAGADFRWRTVVQLADVGPDEPPADDGPALEDDEGLREEGAADDEIAIYQVEVTVAWGEPQDERSLTLTSLRLGALPP
jgi:general secretion pathway protein I